MRFQQGVDERPTRLPMSATESEASSCRTVKILRSMASIEIFFQLPGSSTLYIEKYFQARAIAGAKNEAWRLLAAGLAPPLFRFGHPKGLRPARSPARPHLGPRHAAGGADADAFDAGHDRAETILSATSRCL